MEGLQRSFDKISIRGAFQYIFTEGMDSLELVTELLLQPNGTGTSHVTTELKHFLAQQTQDNHVIHADEFVGT